MSHTLSPNGTIRGKGARGVLAERISLGLAIAEHHARPGQRMSCDALAVFCGVSSTAIGAIEQRALRKLRIALSCRPELQQALREALK